MAWRLALVGIRAWHFTRPAGDGYGGGTSENVAAEFLGASAKWPAGARFRAGGPVALVLAGLQPVHRQAAHEVGHDAYGFAIRYNASFLDVDIVASAERIEIVNGTQVHVW